MDNRDKEKQEKDKKQTPSSKPDQETLDTTDPQENMRGPVSSTMHGTGHVFETDETKEENDRKREEHM